MILKKVYFFSDEATFYLRVLVNKYNIRYWCETNSHVTIESVTKSPKLNVWVPSQKSTDRTIFL